MGLKILRDLSIKSFVTYYLYIKGRNLVEFFVFTLPNYSRIRRIKNLKNSAKGKCAFVFANGPSLNILDPQKVKRLQRAGFDVFAGNSYIQSSFAEIVTPNYYIFSDPAHFGKYLPNMSEEIISRCVADVKIVRDKGISLMIPHRYCQKVKWENTWVFNDSFDPFCKNVADMTKRRGHVTLTLYKALGMACCMGYDEIYICGFDNDYFKKLSVDRDNNLYVENECFYSKEINERVNIRENFAIGISQKLLDCYMSFWGLERFRDFPIINLDPEGLVDCFLKKHDLDVYL